MSSMGKRFRSLVKTNSPLQVVGTINAYSAMLAESVGCEAIYLSGAGVANASYGLPDLGMTSLPDVLEDARRITDACSLPLLVDVDTAWGHAFNIARTVKLMERASVAAIHIEDQVLAKRCGHRPNKAIVSKQEMGDRIKAAVDARCDDNFVIMARTDAYAVEGMAAAVERAQLCVELGADMLFPEAMTTLEEYKEFCSHFTVPVLANITEFGKTPLFSREELKEAGIQLILYPLSAFRAMSQAALTVYRSIMQTGSQKDVVNMMQTRNDLYNVLGYQEYEKKLDQLMEVEDGQ
ncbi:methylisocitrate lyase [Legionella jordanis]|uniref:2-methylisocitrate lyase n=1 Tax=Legionella jordanis TaxID=456 RepID=A0A0W0VAP1_9GAMM|nr:methylisocitrate lyase [Legionella jordanis]KTD17198.1 2-methylisocitrate lyase [Legionella jordanis]RMX03318.1 methylisocitrate lyase [Legionella jordanis]RMX18296.1 methylisocitrate lyase [Legionella jordanis]VEH12604.1 2-methylisocitrate lyase [Legionella jordanis]HAT8713322.1 methylisocitrate lyase [Legionella jordanis]